MAKKKTGRSVKKNPNRTAEPDELVSGPHSFVIHKGLPGGSTIQLTKDFRKVMEPFTASSLKERKKNSIKDFVSVAGPLHVTHLFIFSQTEFGMYLKMMRLPRGPTLTFKINNFTLAKDVVSSLKKQAVIDDAFKTSPLLVLNSFSGEGMQMKLMASMFQNMFPTINLTTVDLNSVRRCVLLNYNPHTKLIDFRHYNIKVVPVGISKGIKKVVQGKVPNLSRCNDISDFFAKTAILSESEAEDDPQNHVTLPQKIVTRGNVAAGQSAVRLSELGPRLTLHLIKIEDGLLNGEVLFHDIIQKTDEEKTEISKRRSQKKELKEKRKKTQEMNKKAKEDAKRAQKEKIIKEANEHIVEDDDKEYYRQEVGEEPDADLFTVNPKKRKSDSQYQIHKFKKRKVDQTNNDYTHNGTNSRPVQKHNGNQFRNEKFPRRNSSPMENRKKRFEQNTNKQHFKKGKHYRKNDTSNFQNRDRRPIGKQFRR